MKLLLALVCLVATCSAAAVSYQASPMFTHDASELAVGGDSWQQAMTKAVAFLVASPLPSNWGQYMSTPTTQGSYGHSRVGFDNYEAEMSKWPIPAVFKQDAFACVGVLVLAASEGQYVGQSFVFSLSAGQGSLTSLVVVAKRDSQPSDPNRPVDVAYYVFSTSARVIQQYTYVQVKECSRCGKCLWIWKCCCSTKTNSIPRGFTPGEVLTVQYRMQRSQYDFYVSSPPRVALSASGSLQALKQLTAPSAPLQLGSNPVADILAALSRFIKRDDVRSEYSSNYTDPIVAELQNVTQTVYTSTSHSHLKGVKDELFDRMMVTLGKAYNVNEFIAPYVEVDRYAPAFSHEVLRQVENTTMMHYVWILGTRAEATGLHDVFLLSTKTQFDISRGNVSGDVNVVRNAVPTDDGDFESASFTVLEAPWGDNTTEVTMDILRFIAALTALKEPLPQPDPDNNPPTPDALVANLEQLVQEFNHPVTMVRGPADLGKAAFGVESVVALTMAVKAVADTWQSIANAFKTTVQTSVKQIIRLGFNHFQQKSTVLKAFGVAEDKVEPFVNMVVKAFQLPDDDKAKLVLFEMQYLPEASWDADDFMYAIPGTGTDKAFMMFKTGNSTSGLANFFIVNIEANFNLAPDLMVVRTQRSFLGGIFSDDKTVISEVPHVLSMSDAVNLQNFFKIIAIGKMCESLGIPYTFPELPPM